MLWSLLALLRTPTNLTTIITIIITTIIITTITTIIIITITATTIVITVPKINIIRAPYFESEADSKKWESNLEAVRAR
jgi:hypothetical protein